VLGHTPEACGALDGLLALREKNYGPALPIAWICLGLGETAKGLDWLETALAECEPFLGSLMVFPAYDRIRDQPEFKRLTRELNFPAP
jgi:hypothetical protein